MKAAVIKAGGSGNVLETAAPPDIPWLAYRRLRFDPQWVKDLVRGVTAAARTYRLALVPGGMGAYLFLELGRDVGLGNDQLQSIGCQVVALNGYLLIEALRASGVGVFPHLVEHPYRLLDALAGHPVAVLGPCAEYLSTDGLAAAAAASIPDAELVFFKKGIPVYHVGFEAPTEVSIFRLSELRSIAREFGERAGSNSILDAQSIDIIERGSVRTRLVNSVHLPELDRVLSGAIGLQQTTIALE